MEHIKQALSYDAESGIFTWIAPTQGRRIQGSQAGYTSTQGYLYIEFEDKAYRANRLAWWWVTGRWPEFEIDHKDQDKLNNSFENLNDVPPSKNCHNRKQYDQENKIGKLPMGVYLRKGKRGDKYRAAIGTGRTVIWLGTYDTPEEAHEVYLKEKVKYV